MKSPAARTLVRPQPPKPVVADEPKLGECLRQLRFDRKLSLTEVSLSTGISKSTLSRVEREQLSLTYDKLLQLCRGLGVDLADLLNRGQRTTRELGRRTMTPPGGGRQVTVNLQTYTYLCTDLAGKKMTPMTGTILSPTLAETNGLLKHEGEEFTYVLEGRLKLHTEFYEPLVLDVGGSVYFDSTMGHAYVSVGSTPLTILCVCSTPEPALMQALGLEGANAPRSSSTRPVAVRKGKRARTRTSNG